MKQAPHPLLAGLWRDGAAPAQAVARWQAQRPLLAALSQGLQQVGVDGDDPWAALLRAPLAAGDGDAALRLALQSLEEDEPAQDQPVAGPAALRAAGADNAAIARSNAALPPATPADAPRKAAAAAAEVPRRRDSTPPVPRSISASAAAAHWQQRAQAAGLADAYRTPLRGPGGAGSTAAAGSTGPSSPPSRFPGPALPPTAAEASALSTSFAGPLPAEAARGLQPATERIEVLLARLQPSASKPSGNANASGSRRMAPDVATPATPAAAAAAAQAAMRSSQPAGQAAGTVQLLPAQQAALSAGLAGFGGGLRGLAARAAAAAPTQAAGATATQAPTAAAQPTVTSARHGAWTADSPPAPPDDDRLAERLAQLLRREALRDGIDLSEVRT